MAVHNIDYLLDRRSVKAAALIDPAPSAQQLEQILTAATRVPDHGKLAPWRLWVLDKAQQIALGEHFSRRFASLNPDATEAQIAFERQRPQRAPLLIVVVMEPKEGKIPLWEQQLSTGAVCMNLLHAAHALGLAGNWLTEWPAFDNEITALFSTAQGVKIAGFIYLGSASIVPEDRPRPNLDDVVHYKL